VGSERASVRFALSSSLVKYEKAARRKKKEGDRETRRSLSGEWIMMFEYDSRAEKFLGRGMREVRPQGE
jgi:hypothetical protein